MAVRIREDGTIVCAAMSEEQPGDTYIHDGLHYLLSVELGALVAEPMEKHQHDGLWWWRNQVPADRSPDRIHDEMYLENTEALVEAAQRRIKGGNMPENGEAHYRITEEAEPAQSNTAMVTAKPPKHRAFRWTGNNFDEAFERFGGEESYFYNPSLGLRLLIDGVKVRPSEWVVYRDGKYRTYSDDGFKHFYEQVEEEA